VRRKVFTVVAVLSLVLCFAMVGLWVRSYWWGDLIASPVREGPLRRRVAGVSWRGKVCLLLSRQRMAYGEGMFYSMRLGVVGADLFLESFFEMGGRRVGAFAVGSSSDAVTGESIYWMTMPDWVVCTMFVIPIVWRCRRGFGDRHGKCKCGYELTGNTSGVCPECGTAISPPAKAA
jgi:hypothetical protein